MKIKFFNNYHNGDITLSRNFVRDIISKTQGRFDSYEYEHENSSRILMDIPNLTHIRTSVKNNDRMILEEIEDILFINTWFNPHFPAFSRYNGCSLKTLYENFRVVYEHLKIPLENILFYLPSYNWTYFNTSGIDEWIKNNTKKTILVCNSTPKSEQTEMNKQSWEQLIHGLYQMYKDDSIIIYTEPLTFSADGLIYSHEIIGHDIENLPEHAYLSHFVDEIIHCDSSPGSFTFTDVNYYRKAKMKIYSYVRNFYPAENEL